ncbi:hypothetical protein CEXT_425401, partial [Caerostris extrusa]
LNKVKFDRNEFIDVYLKLYSKSSDKCRQHKQFLFGSEKN